MRVKTFWTLPLILVGAACDDARTGPQRGRLTFSEAGVIYDLELSGRARTTITEGQVPHRGARGDLVYVHPECISEPGEVCYGSSLRHRYPSDLENVLLPDITDVGAPAIDASGLRVAIECVSPDPYDATCVLRTDGGATQLIEVESSRPSWAGDARLALGGEPDFYDDYTNFYIAEENADGGYETRSISVDTSVRFPTFHPDGEHVLFQGAEELYKVEIYGDPDLTPVTAFSDNNLGWPVYSPDAAWVAFVYDGEPGNYWFIGEADDPDTGSSDTGSLQCSLWAVLSSGGEPVQIHDAAGEPVMPDCNSRISWTE